MLKHLTLNAKNNFKIVGYTVLKPHRKNKTIVDWVFERVKIYSYIELIIVFCAMMIVKTFNCFGGVFSCKKVLRQTTSNELITTDINSGEYIDKLIKLDIDIIISISCPQLFGANLLEIPKLGCINAHGTLLPMHRGVFGSWWTLYCEDKKAGGTIHTMELRLDAGDIMWQKEFLVKEYDTQYSIAYKTKKIMAQGLIETIKNFEKKVKNPLNNNYKSSYHKAPSKKLGRKFRKKGLRIIKLSNLKEIFLGQY